MLRFGISEQKEEELQAAMERLGIAESDLVERFVRGSGPGGQKINKTSVAVYLKHLPTGMEVKVQQARSQSLNRYYARKALVDKMDEAIQGKASKAQQAREKVRRQKRKRSKRAKEKVLAAKHKQSEKKSRRKAVSGKDGW